MAKFLQDTVSQMAIVSKNSENLSLAKEFSEAFRKARMTGEALSSHEIIVLTKGLSDTITLENLPRAQLVSICRYMSLNAFGTDGFLRYQIRKRMKEIKADDELIDEEGIENLTFDELVSACHSRGIKSVGKISRARLETELKQWLELHLRSEVPSVLLILSRALTMQDPEMEPVEALQNVIMSLPEHVVEEAKLEASEIIGDSSNNYKQKLHVLEQQEGMIAEELAQEEKEKAQRASQAIVGEITPEEAERISMAISELSPLSHEKEELKELKEDVADFKEEANELKQASEENLQVSKEADVLEGQIENLIADIDVDI